MKIKFNMWHDWQFSKNVFDFALFQIGWFPIGPKVNTFTITLLNFSVSWDFIKDED